MNPLSYVAEYSYCPRSAYYLFTNTPRVRDENVFIQSGRQVHQSVDQGYSYTKAAKKVESSVWVYSERLALRGKVDILEFYADKTLVPIEIKRGRCRENQMHTIQLALMALCLKDMFPQYRLEKSAIFFKEDKQKKDIELSESLLEKAEAIANDVKRKVERGLFPGDFPRYLDERCEGCCFYHLCYLED